MCITPSVLFVKNYQFSIPRRSANVQYVYQSLPVSKPGMNLLCHDRDRARKHRPLLLHRKDSERREQRQMKTRFSNLTMPSRILSSCEQRYGNFPNNKTIAPPNLTIRLGFIHLKHRQKNVILTGTAPFSCVFPLSGLLSPCVSQPVPPLRRSGCG